MVLSEENRARLTDILTRLRGISKDVPFEEIVTLKILSKTNES